MSIELRELTARPSLDFPPDCLRLILVQPSVSLGTTNRHQMDTTEAVRQMALLRQTISMARTKGAHVVVFPEYGLPGARWRDVLVAAKDLPANALLVAGLDSVTYETYLQLARDTQTVPKGLDPEAHRNEWVNCGLVIAKGQDEAVEHFVQPKLFPAMPEQARVGAMFQGQRVEVLRVGQYCIGLLICRDLIHRVHVHSGELVDLSDWLIGQLRSKGLQLDFLFVIQYNPKPTDEGFVRAKGRLLESGSVRCIMVANHAPFGKTGLYVPESRYQVSLAASLSVGICHPNGYALPALARTTRPHVFLWQHRPLVGITGQRNVAPVEPVEEYPIVDGQCQGTGELRPVYYWPFMELNDRHPSHDTEQIPDNAVRTKLGQHYESLQATLANIPCAKVIEDLLGVLFGGVEVQREPLRWDHTSRATLADLVRCLATLQFAGQVRLPAAAAATTAQFISQPESCEPITRHVVVLAGGRDRRVETCIHHYASHTSTHLGALPELMVMVVLDYLDPGRHFPLTVHIVGFDRQRLDQLRVELAPIDRGPLPEGAAAAEETRPVRLAQPTLSVPCHSGRALEGYLFNLGGVAEVSNRIHRDVTS